MFIVIGGELVDPRYAVFKAPEAAHYVGTYLTKEEAEIAWRAASYASVDNALMRYFVVPM